MFYLRKKNKRKAWRAHSCRISLHTLFTGGAFKKEYP